MAPFAFEVIGTVCGLPDPLSYDESLYYNPRLRGASKVVVEEFDSEEEARRYGTMEGGTVWNKHCPPIHKDPDAFGGLDVEFICQLPENWQRQSSGRTSCGCVHHAEEGVPCDHDIALFVREINPLRD